MSALPITVVVENATRPIVYPQGSTRPALRVGFRDGDGDRLTSHVIQSATAHLSRRGDRVTTRDGRFDGDAGETVVVDWRSGDLDTPGWHTLRFELALRDGGVLYAPTETPLRVNLTD